MLAFNDELGVISLSLLNTVVFIVDRCRNEPGFLKMFNGYWDVEPRMVNGKSVGCNVVVTQEVLPSMLPPGPLGAVHGFVILHIALFVLLHSSRKPESLKYKTQEQYERVYNCINLA